eukprot:GHVL01027083.1.p1 GENE.GHVL01027083.1~~GHVL01027083.1.p1  ORF type:complete len:758 (+),score=222.36 GHVL01027083.1:2405-4678(+)
MCYIYIYIIMYLITYNIYFLVLKNCNKEPEKCQILSSSCWTLSNECIDCLSKENCEIQACALSRCENVSNCLEYSHCRFIDEYTATHFNPSGQRIAVTGTVTDSEGISLKRSKFITVGGAMDICSNHKCDGIVKLDDGLYEIRQNIQTTNDTLVTLPQWIKKIEYISKENSKCVHLWSDSLGVSYYVQPGESIVGSERKIFCADGYSIPVGGDVVYPNILVCQENGYWTDLTIECYANCKRYESPGVVSPTDMKYGLSSPAIRYKHGHWLTGLTCSSGYISKNISNENDKKYGSALCNNGVWINESIICDISCHIYDIKKGEIISDDNITENYRINDILIVKCDTFNKYYPKNNEIIEKKLVCTEDGSWKSDVDLHCEVKCSTDNIEIPTGAEIKLNNENLSVVGSFYHIQCKKDIFIEKLNNQSNDINKTNDTNTPKGIIRCLSDGSWSKSMIECREVGKLGIFDGKNNIIYTNISGIVPKINQNSIRMTLGVSIANNKVTFIKNGIPISASGDITPDSLFSFSNEAPWVIGCRLPFDMENPDECPDIFSTDSLAGEIANNCFSGKILAVTVFSKAITDSDTLDELEKYLFLPIKERNWESLENNINNIEKSQWALNMEALYVANSDYIISEINDDGNEHLIRWKNILFSENTQWDLKPAMLCGINNPILINKDTIIMGDGQFLVSDKKIKLTNNNEVSIMIIVEPYGATGIEQNLFMIKNCINGKNDEKICKQLEFGIDMGQDVMNSEDDPSEMS